MKPQTKPVKRWIIGMTGASGAAYGIKLCDSLLSMGIPIDLVITDAGWRVLNEEAGWESSKRQAVIADRYDSYGGLFRYYINQDIGALIASGSNRSAGMVIIPCSMGTLSAIAHGLSDNLLERAADVILKEGGKLLIVPRETPLHSIHLQNMLTLSNMGVRIIPAMPAFYNKPLTLDDMIAFIVSKVMDSMGIEHDLFTRWGD